MKLPRLTKAEIDKIHAHTHVFLSAEELTGVPWEAVAAIWYRESFSVASPKRIGGPFQFDPPPAEATMRYLLKRYTKLHPGEYQKYLTKGVNYFDTAAVLAACWARHSCRPVIHPACTDEEIKAAFWGYNGKAYGSADKSPYVMNGYSEQHMGNDGEGMPLSGTVPDIHDPTKRVKIPPRPEKRPGALVVYKQLKGELS